MPLLWIALSGLSGLVVGTVYEKETSQPVVTTPNSPSFSWWDKTLLVALGLGAYYIYKKA